MKRTALVVALSLLVPAVAFGQSQFKPSEIFRTPGLEVGLPDFPASGLILDVGGGGEGVIGQLKGSQVVAIDLSKQYDVTSVDVDPAALIKLAEKHPIQTRQADLSKANAVRDVVQDCDGVLTRTSSMSLIPAI